MASHRILAFGSRSYDDASRVHVELASLPFLLECEPSEITIVHGACPNGADALADSAARELGMTVERHPADWNAHGKKAGFIRNAEMVATRPDMAIGFFDGWTNGSADTLRRCIESGVDVHVISTARRPK